MKRRQKAGFLSPRSSKIIVTKEKERRKRKSEENERRGRAKKQWFSLLVFHDSYFRDRFLAEKNCWTLKVYLAITFSKIQLAIIWTQVILSPSLYSGMQFLHLKVASLYSEKTNTEESGMFSILREILRNPSQVRESIDLRLLF